MKKFALGIVVGLFLSGSVLASYLYKADEVSYTPKDNNWDVNNVEGAINDLYDKANNSGANGTLKIVGTLKGSAWNSPGYSGDTPTQTDPNSNTKSSTVTIIVKIKNGNVISKSITGGDTTNYQRYFSSYNWVVGRSYFNITSVTWSDD